MKKRVLSMLLAFILCFSTLPMTAFAQETDAVVEQEEQQEADSAEEQEEQQGADSAEGQEKQQEAAPDTVKPSAESVSDSDAGTQDTGADDEKKAAVQKVQALIDALPDEVTADNADELQAQLMAIDEAMEALTEEQIAALDMERFDAICAALTGLVAVQAEEHVHPICGTTCNDGKNHQNVTWTATKELTNDMAAGNYYLTTDITLSQPWVPKNNVNLCLNGHNITFTKNTSDGGVFDYNVIGIKNIKLNLCDAHGQGTVFAEKGASGDVCGGVTIEENGVFNLYDGAKINAHDWGVWIDEGCFNMYGGTVTGKEREGVHVSQTAEFNMKGGEIRDCEICGGVLVMGRSTSNSNSLVGGRFEMTGGKICNNTSAGAENGGGVTVLYGQYGSGILNMEGGEISGNKAKNGNGGGVYIKCNADDTSYYPGRFTMLGGTISGNTAENGKGGGVYVETDRSTKNVAMFIFGRDAKITNNTDSNVYLCDNNTIVISWYGLESGASMGVTLEKLPAEGDYTVIATDARSHYVEGAITSDVAGYKTLCSDNEVILYSETTKLHTHPVCGKTCEHDGAHAGEVWRGVSSLDEIKTGGYYYLTQNIELNKTWSPVEGVKLCLNGHNITANTDVDVITMPQSGSFMIFTLTDCMGENGTTYGKITHTEGKEGHGIYVKNRVVMYGGKISGNTVGTYGNGGGVYVYDSCEFEMHGGSITGNSAGHGGGVYFRDSGSFTMDGGSITDNSASSSGGGVYLSQGSFTVSGKAKITNNTLSDNATANNVGGWGYSIKVDTPGLDNTASIGVTTSDIAEGSYVVVAEGIETYKKSYQLTETDLNCFNSDAGYIPKLINNSIVFTNGNMHEHPICSDTDCKDGHDDALWLPLTYENNQLKYGGTTASSTTTTGPGYANTDKYDTITEYTLPKGNYYLADNITIDGTIKISGNVNLCLNGHTISTNSNKVSYAVIYTQYWNLSICDCTGKGSLKVPNNGVTNGIQTSDDISDEKGSLYLYGGTISGGNCGVNVKGQLYLYGGTITGNSCGVSDAQKITIGGNVKITNNTCKNVELSSGKIITIDKSLTKDAQIGITTFPKPSKTTPSIQIAAGADGSLKYTDIFKSDMTDYVITQTGTDLYLGIHQHNWTYSAEGAMITIRCNAENCNLGTDFAATYTVTQPEDFIYSGSEKPATVEVSENATDLTLPEKPTVTYQKKNGNEFEILNGVPTDVGTYRASITIDNVTASVTYNIVSKEVPNPTITVAGTYTYDGTEKKPSVVVKDGEKVIPDSEYSVSYADNINAGAATVTITDVAGGNYDVSGSTTFTINKGAYNGTVEKKVTIIKKRSTAQTGTLTAADFFPEVAVPEGAVISDVNGSFDSDVMNPLTLDQDAGKISYITAANITSTTDQTCSVIISSTNYQDIEATLTFHPTDKETVTIKGLTYTDKTYDGSAMEPAGTLKVSDDKVPVKELEVLYEGTSANGTNYSSSSAPKDAGAYKVTYKVADSNENYTGSVEYTFTISPKNVTAGMIDTIAAQEYTGSAITPEPVVKDGEVTLISGTDFYFTYDQNINAGENTATVTINGQGNYTRTASRTFTIKPKDIKGAAITLQSDSLGYTGLMQEVQITSVTLGQVTLTANDYDIVNDSNKQISADDSITLTIAGKGNYTGMATTTWKITKATPELGNFDVTPDLSQKQTYDGKPKEVTAKTKNGVIDMGNVTVCYEGTSGTTYTRRETAPTNAGIYKVILSVAEGKNYTAAEIEAGTLNIDKADLTVEDVTEFFEYTKTGAQTINIANLVPGTRSYALGTAAGDLGVLSEAISIDATTGLMKFTLSALTKGNVDNKVTVPVTITSENYEDVTVNVIIYISPEYRIIDGAGSTWTQNTDGTVVIRGNGEFNRFHAVKVDGKVIDPANYEAKEGSTIITLKAEYLKTLATGSHTFAIVWNNGIAGTNFTVAANISGNNSGNNSNNNDSNHGSDNSGNNDSGNTAGAAANTAAASAQELDKIPATGDPFGIWLTLFAISLTGLAGMLARRKKQ